MKDEIIIDKKLKRLVEEFVQYLETLSPELKKKPEEITLEDCVKGSTFTVDWSGLIKGCSPYPSWVGFYPTSAIAEKVLLYGLLQSVAYKLNGNAMFGAVPHIVFLSNQKRLDVSEYHGTYTISPVFLGKETAKQAIKIFENSKFDLKKLFQ